MPFTECPFFQGWVGVSFSVPQSCKSSDDILKSHRPNDKSNLPFLQKCSFLCENAFYQKKSCWLAAGAAAVLQNKSIVWQISAGIFIHRVNIDWRAERGKLAFLTNPSSSVTEPWIITSLPPLKHWIFWCSYFAKSTRPKRSKSKGGN